MLEIAKQLFYKFDSCDISYCHFKSNEHLKEGLLGQTDLDLLISPQHKHKCDIVLSELKFKNFEPEIIGEYPGVTNWYGFDKNTGMLVHLHIHYQLATGKGLIKDYIIPWSDVILQTSIRDNETRVKITNPNIEYILLCTRLVVKRKLIDNIKSYKNMIFIQNDAKKEIQYLKKLINEKDLKKYVYMLFSEKNANEIYKLILFIENLRLKEFRKLDKIIRKELSTHRRMNGLTASSLSFKNRSIRSLNRKINKFFGIILPVKKRSIKRGISIAFVGIDGSGKSTVSTEINNWLGLEFDTIRYYAGAGDGKKNLLTTILLKGYSSIRKNNLKFNKINNRDNEAVTQNINKSSFFNKIKNLLGAMVYYKILKDNIKKISKANKHCIEGCFCIMDRYPQSQIEGDHDGPKVSKYLNSKQFGIVEMLAKKENKLLKKLDCELPKFDLLFRMNVSPQIALNRKPDHNYIAMERRALSLKTITFGARKIVDINADDCLDDVILKVKENIWDTI